MRNTTAALVVTLASLLLPACNGAPDIAGTWVPDMEAIKKGIQAKLATMDDETRKANEIFFTAIVVAFQKTRYQMASDGTYRGYIESGDTVSHSNGNWELSSSIDRNTGDRRYSVTFRQTHLDDAEVSEVQVAQYRASDGRLVRADDLKVPFVLMREQNP